MNNKVNLAISIGGTKLAEAIVGEDAQIISKTGRIEWHNDPLWRPEDFPGSLLALAASYAKKLLRQANVKIEDVKCIGIAWPGPGRYSQGILSATFIPGCIDQQPVHQLMLDAFRKQFDASLDHLEIISRFDLNVRAKGEIRSPHGAFYAAEGSPKLSGTVLNIATGIAGAIVKEGYALPTFESLGETYGQWGRYIFLQEDTETWIWRPTDDGSIPAHSDNEIRFTRRCGGPALAHRFFERCSALASAVQLPADLVSALNAFPTDPNQRNLKAEKSLLIQITQNAYQCPDSVACRFVEEAGVDIGCAVRCLLDALGETTFGNKLLLTGGIGEFFGKPPPHDSQTEDILLSAIQKTLNQKTLNKPGIDIIRSELGLDAEFIGFAS